MSSCWDGGFARPSSWFRSSFGAVVRRARHVKRDHARTPAEEPACEGWGCRQMSIQSSSTDAGWHGIRVVYTGIPPRPVVSAAVRSKRWVWKLELMMPCILLRSSFALASEAASGDGRYLSKSLRMLQWCSVGPWPRSRAWQDGLDPDVWDVL